MANLLYVLVIWALFAHIAFFMLTLLANAQTPQTKGQLALVSAVFLLAVIVATAALK